MRRLLDHRTVVGRIAFRTPDEGQQRLRGTDGIDARRDLVRRDVGPLLSVGPVLPVGRCCGDERRQRHGAVASSRRERQVAGRLNGIGGAGFRDCLGRAVSRARARHDRPEDALQLFLVALQRMPLVDLEVRGGQRAGLVQAERVHVAQRLHRVRLLDERTHPRDPHCRQRVGDGDRHEEAIGNEPGEDRGLTDDLRYGDRLGGALEDQQHLQVHDDREHDPDDKVDFLLDRGEDPAEAAGVGNDLVRVARLADGGHLVPARARHAEGARRDPVSGRLVDGVRLARQLRLVDLDLAPDELAVEDDLVAQAQVDEVAEDEVLGLHDALNAAPSHRRRRLREDRDAVQRPLGADLLVDRDGDVRADHADGHGCVEGPADDDQRDRQEEQDVVHERERVLHDDREVGAGRRRRCLVPLTAFAAGGDLGLVETRPRVDVGVAGRRHRGRGRRPGGDGDGHRRQRTCAMPARTGEPSGGPYAALMDSVPDPRRA